MLRFANKINEGLISRITLESWSPECNLLVGGSKRKLYGTKVRVSDSDIEQRNVSGAEIYGIGFTVRAKSLRWEIPKIDRDRDRDRNRNRNEKNREVVIYPRARPRPKARPRPRPIPRARPIQADPFPIQADPSPIQVDPSPIRTNSFPIQAGSSPMDSTESWARRGCALDKENSCFKIQYPQHSL